jgi:hypothetical protein
VWRRQVGFVRGTGGQRGQVRAAWWHEQQDEVVDGFLVEPQNQGRAGTTWEPSHEWRLARATPSSRGLQWFTRKSLGYSVEPQIEAEDSTRRCGHPSQFNRPGGAVRLLGLGRSDCPGRSNRPEGRSDRPGRWCRDASKRRTRVGIARLASRLSRLRSPGIRPMKKIRRLPNSPLRGLYP